MIKIYLAHSRDPRFDYQNEFYQPLLSNFTLHQLILPHAHMAEATFDSRQVIPKCVALIAEVSYPSTGLGMELAWAEAANLPVLCLHKQDFLPSSSILNLCNHVQAYKNAQDLIKIARVWIAQERQLK